MVLKNILIAVPSSGGVIKAKTAATLVFLMRQLTRAGVTADYASMDSADVVYARNSFARTLLASERLDGLLFVDSDMQFRPALVMKMLRLDVDFAATAYPKRELDIERFARAASKAESLTAESMARALANTYQYTVVPSWERRKKQEFELKRGFAKMAAAGMGCALISRAALRAMIDGGVVSQRRDVMNGVEEVGWGFFDPVVTDGLTLSEDYSFCWRWTRMLGRDLWVNVDEPVTHLGEFAFRTRYIDRLNIIAPPGAAPGDDRAADPSGASVDPEAEVVIDAPT